MTQDRANNNNSAYTLKPQTSTFMKMNGSEYLIFSFLGNQFLNIIRQGGGGIYFIARFAKVLTK